MLMCANILQRTALSLAVRHEAIIFHFAAYSNSHRSLIASNNYSNQDQNVLTADASFQLFALS
jgi:hypothetical protein